MIPIYFMIHYLFTIPANKGDNNSFRVFLPHKPNSRIWICPTIYSLDCRKLEKLCVFDLL